jgi:DNA-binding transcriptional ArsR family regulator
MSVQTTLTALADPTRLGVVTALRAGPQRAGELAAVVGTSAPALTRHLRALREAELVEERPLPEDGRVRVYHLRPEPFAALSDWATELTAFWTDQLDGFAAHIAARRAP